MDIGQKLNDIAKTFHEQIQVLLVEVEACLLTVDGVKVHTSTIDWDGDFFFYSSLVETNLGQKELEIQARKALGKQVRVESSGDEEFWFVSCGVIQPLNASKIVKA